MKVNVEKIKKFQEKKAQKHAKVLSMNEKIDGIKQRLENKNLQKIYHGTGQIVFTTMSGITEQLSKTQQAGEEYNPGAKINRSLLDKSKKQLNNLSFRMSKKGRKVFTEKKQTKLKNKVKRELYKIKNVDYKIAKEHLKVSSEYRNSSFIEKRKMEFSLKRKVMGKKSLRERTDDFVKKVKNLPKNILNDIKNAPQNLRKSAIRLRTDVLTSIRNAPANFVKFLKNAPMQIAKRAWFWGKAILLLLLCLLVFQIVGGLFNAFFSKMGGAAVSTYTNNPGYLLDFEDEWQILEEEKRREIDELESKYLSQGYDEFYLEPDEEFLRTGVSHDPHLVASYMNAEYGIIEENITLLAAKGWIHSYFSTIYTMKERPSTRTEAYVVCSNDDEGNEVCTTHTRVIRIMTIELYKKNIEEELDGFMAANPKEVREFYEAIRGTLGNMPDLFASYYTLGNFEKIKLEGKNNAFNVVPGENRNFGDYQFDWLNPHGARGHCTHFVYSMVGKQGHQLSGMGNAKQWVNSAQNKGLQVDRTVKSGSVVVFQPGVAGAGGYGHVAMVERVNADGSYTILEGNGPAVYGGGLGKVNRRTISAEDARKAHYIHLDKKK